MTKAQKKRLCQMAMDAMNDSYAPYSNFKVGAAVLCEDGRIFTGCNVENLSYSATVCAERVAVYKAISEGTRRFSAIAVAGGEGGRIAGRVTPCGVCRQVLSEFCDWDMPVLVVKLSDGEYEEYTMRDLLPEAFEF